MQSIINGFLWGIKWPMAFLMVLLTIPAILSIKDIISFYLTAEVMIWFGIPFLICAVGLLFLPYIGASFLAILEHELTHMIFALLTFHKPVDLDVQQNKGGSFSFKGTGNWLIALAPYFFPTFAVCVVLASLVYISMEQPLPHTYWAILGTMTGYHLASTILEIHPKQTDFKVAGYLFTILFLPGANAIFYGMLLSFACLGWNGIGAFFNALGQNTLLFIGKILQSQGMM